MISAQDAVHAVYRERVVVIEDWDQVFRSPSTTIRVPKVVQLRHFAPVYGVPKFCRRSVFLRDRYRCQYCGVRFQPQDLTFDHFVPRSKQGRTEWGNILTSCIPCNAAKADKHLHPLSVPHQPTHIELLVAGLEFLPNDMQETFGDWLWFSIAAAA